MIVTGLRLADLLLSVLCYYLRMRRSTAKHIHEATNIAYWMEKPNWDPGSAAFNLICKAFQILPFSVHEIQKKAIFDTERLIAVNGETVVATSGTDKVDKFMFRYPNKMPLETFKKHVAREVGAVTTCLTGIALTTEVGIKPADIFRHIRRPVPTVVQTQQRLDLGIHRALSLSELESEAASPRLDRTARDLEKMLYGTGTLAAEYGLFPDLADNSNNLRRSTLDGAVTLMDVMPIYADGDRLIGDHPPGLLAHAQKNIQNYQAFVGRYGG